MNKRIWLSLAHMGGREQDFIKEAFDTNWVVPLGPNVDAFEESLRQFLVDNGQLTIDSDRRVVALSAGTAALHLGLILLGVKPGDEVIMPSYTFVSTADAFVLRGATCVFVDIRPDTMNIDETKIEEAITEKTKAIVPVHYAGVSCAMDEIMAIAKKYNLKVVEDAAQGVNAFYKGKALGTIGDFGCYSFHETKNYSMGEGGAILFQDDRYLEPAEILREKGTNRSQYFRGQIDKYTWVGYGSSYLPSDMNAAYLWAQLEEADKINDKRLSIWNFYHEELKELEDKGVLERPYIPEYATHNAHMYYIKVKDLRVRTKLLAYLKERGILSVFHYVPLHSATAGKKFGRFHGEDVYTTKESERLCRLPMYYSLSLEEAAEVVKALKEFPEYETIEDR